MSDGNYATVNGINTWFRVMNFKKNSIPIFFVHGGPGGSSFQFEMNAGRELAKDFTVVVYDQRGCGRSGPPQNSDYSIDSLTRDLDELRKTLGFEKITVLGSSFGGEIAMQYSLAYPDHIKYLLLEGSSNGDHLELMKMQFENFKLIADKSTLHRIDQIWSEDKSIPEKYFEMWSILNEEIVDRFIFHSEKNAKAVRKIWRSQTWKSNQEMAKAIWKKIPVGPYLYQKLKSVTTPTLILVGRHDFNTGIPMSQKIKDYLPNSKLIIFENSGHFPDVEETGLFKTAISDFIRN